jgi:hypothetical protein
VQPGTVAFAHDNFLQKQDVELGWIRNVMRGASLDGMRVPAVADAAQLEAVIEEWIGTPQSGGQLAYYSRAALRRERLHRRAERLGLACIGLGVGLSVLLALFARRFDAHTKHVLVSAMGILSVAAAVHEAYMHKKADKELVRQYSFMQRIFASARRMLDDAQDMDEQRRILLALGEAALSEHAEWTLMHRERPLPNSRIRPGAGRSLSRPASCRRRRSGSARGYYPAPRSVRPPCGMRPGRRKCARWSTNRRLSRIRRACAGWSGRA